MIFCFSVLVVGVATNPCNHIFVVSDCEDAPRGSTPFETATLRFRFEHGNALSSSRTDDGMRCGRSCCHAAIPTFCAGIGRRRHPMSLQCVRSTGNCGRNTYLTWPSGFLKSTSAEAQKSRKRCCDPTPSSYERGRLLQQCPRA